MSDPWQESDFEGSEDQEDLNFTSLLFQALKKSVENGTLFQVLPWLAVSILGFRALYRGNLLWGLGGALTGIVSLKLATTQNSLPAQVAGVAALAGLGVLNVTAGLPDLENLGVPPGPPNITCPPPLHVRWDFISRKWYCSIM